MSIARILARLDGTGGDRAVLQAAHEVATEFTAHIDGVHIKFDTRDLPLITGYGPVDDISILADSLQRTATHSQRLAHQHFNEWIDATGVRIGEEPGTGSVSASWSVVEDREATAMARLGRLSDLIVVVRPDDTNALSSMTALESAIFDTRRAVLMVPQVDADVPLLHRPLVAWNGSPEATLALASALPLLKKAEGPVGIFAAAETKQTGNAEELVAYLAWHGIASEPAVPSDMTLGTGAGLLWAAEASGAGMLVMGAYSTQGRLRQMLMGGVTSHVFAHAKIPVLLAR